MFTKGQLAGIDEPKITAEQTTALIDFVMKMNNKYVTKYDKLDDGIYQSNLKDTKQKLLKSLTNKKASKK